MMTSPATYRTAALSSSSCGSIRGTTDGSPRCARASKAAARTSQLLSEHAWTSASPLLGTESLAGMRVAAARTGDCNLNFGLLGAQRGKSKVRGPGVVLHQPEYPDRNHPVAPSFRQPHLQRRPRPVDRRLGNHPKGRDRHARDGCDYVQIP